MLSKPTFDKPLETARAEEAVNFKLLGHDASAGFGGGSIVEVRNGYAFVGSVGASSFTAPEGFTVHDVRDPRKPRKVAEFKAPPGVHMHKLRIVDGDFLYVNSERLSDEAGKKAKGGLFIFDISKPEAPRQVGFFDLPGKGPHRFGVDNKRKLAFLPNEAEGYNQRVIWTLDIKDPLKPEVASIWGLPEQKMTGPEQQELSTADLTVSVHGPPMIRGNRMYAAFWGGGVVILDCTDLSNMKLIGRVGWTPPFIGKTHTAWPLGDRPYMIVTDEAQGKTKHWGSQFMWVVDMRDEANPVPVSCFFPDRDKYFDRAGRFGAHNVLEHMPADGPWKDTVFITYFNAGLRAVNVSDPLQPKEVGCYVPAVAAGAPEIQSNDIGTDEHGRLYLIDRWGQGMHVLEYTG